MWKSNDSKKKKTVNVKSDLINHTNQPSLLLNHILNFNKTKVLVNLLHTISIWRVQKFMNILTTSIVTLEHNSFVLGIQLQKKNDTSH